MRLGLYVQVPFCQTKCTYCNFHTGVFSNDLYAPYVEAVCREIAAYPRLLRESRIAEVPEPVVDTAYFGGGTPSLLHARGFAPRLAEVPDPVVYTAYVGGGPPSLLDPAGLARVLDAMRAAFECKFEEVTLEADPETIIPEKAPPGRKPGSNATNMAW